MALIDSKYVSHCYNFTFYLMNPNKGMHLQIKKQAVVICAVNQYTSIL